MLSRVTMAVAAAASPPRPRSVCVIGAGAAGLASAKALRAAGLECTVLEQREEVGGVWNRRASHTTAAENPVYDSLHTNLPKEMMQFWDFPWDASLPSFVSHGDVQRYLVAYAEAHGLGAASAAVRLRTRVERVWRDGGDWCVTSRSCDDAGAPALTERYAAVVVANGHFATPIMPPLEGRAGFEAAGAKVVHSSAYRSPAGYGAGRGVVVVGSGPSGVDIALELADAGADVSGAGLEHKAKLAVSGACAGLPVRGRTPYMAPPAAHRPYMAGDAVLPAWRGGVAASARRATDVRSGPRPAAC